MSEFSIHGVIKTPLQRVISLAPSVTEMLYYLGLGGSVVGVTRHCNYPPAVSAVERIGSFSMPDPVLIQELSPDLIIGLSDLHRHVPEILKDKQTGVILLDYHGIEGILDAMDAIASLGEESGAAASRVASLRRRVDRLNAGAGGDRPIRTVFLISESPIMLPSRNSYHYDTLQIAGAAQMTSGYTKYERVTQAEVVYFDPEIILSCGRHRGEPARQMCPDCRSQQPPCQRIVEDIALKPGWRETRAARSGNIVAVPCHWLCRPGPRLIDGLESVAKIIQDYRRR